MARNPPTSMRHDRATDRAYVRWKGKKIYFGRWNSADAARDFGSWLTSVIERPNLVKPRGKITVTECVEYYLQHAERYYSRNGEPTGEYANVAYALQDLLRFAGGRTDYAEEFGPRRLIEIQQALATDWADEKSKLRLARNTINARIHRIRRCFRWCASQELISASVVTALDMVPGIPKGRTQARESAPVDAVAVSVVRATLPFLSPTVSAMARVQMLCGMRPQDICGMSGAGIDQSGEIWLYRPASHKTAHLGRSLVKAIPPAAQSIIRPFLRDDPSEPLFSPTDSLEYWRALERKPCTKAKPVTRPRRQYSSASYGKAIVYAIDRAAQTGLLIPHWAPNQLRHSIATQLRGTNGIEAAQLFLGHSKPDTTLIYAERSIDALSEIARQLVSPFDDAQ
jgi:integrase